LIDLVIVLVIRLFCGANALFSCNIDDERPRLYYANHSSLFDFLVIWAALPASQRKITRAAAARDYWTKNPLRYFLAVKVFKATLIERRHPTQENNPLADMLEVLDANRSLIIFPEGTRGTGEGIGQFQSGIYHLCRERPQVEAVPVYLENLNRILPKGELLPLPLLCRVVFGEPLHLAPSETRQAFLERARQAVLTLGLPQE
jgi:1-acyl-sn-glycerol-3-phosphate acyltransferase